MHFANKKINNKRPHTPRTLVDVESGHTRRKKINILCWGVTRINSNNKNDDPY